ncbi:MAG: hypothetical protein PHU85_11485 [Phycisphaerae bacterium]|nr:hypothetical protein [Phycisphaerae bacterium]
MARQLAGGLEPLKPLTPYGYGKRQRKERDYSFDPQAQDRQQKVTLHELQQRGSDVLRERIGELPKRDDRGTITRVLDVLDVPRNAVANAIANLTGTDTSKLPSGTLQKKVYFSDLLKGMGLGEGPVQSIVGFAGDILLDPLTYASLGGTTGTRIATHLPRIVGQGAGMVKAAAQTGQAAAPLAKALATRRALPEIFARLARQRGPEAARKLLASKGGGMLTQRLARQATRGTTEALEFIRQFGQKGRPMLRAPFASKGILELPFGAEARKYKAVTEAFTPEGAELWKTFARKYGVNAARKARAAVTASKAANAAQIRGQAREEAAQIGGKLGPRAARARLREGATEVRKIGPGAKAGDVEEAARKAAVGQQLFKAYTEGENAPGVIRELARSQRGVAPLEGAPGIANWARAFKAKHFGPGPSPLWQQMVGVEGQYGAGAASAASRAKAAFGKKLEPIIQRLAKQGNLAPDDVRQMVYHVAEAGPGGRGLADTLSTDALRAVYARAQQAGITGDPQLRSLLDEYYRTTEGFLKAEKAAGLRSGEVQDYVHRIVTPEGKAQLAMQQQGRGMTNRRRQVRPGGRMSVNQPPSVPRSYLREFTDEAGQTRHVLNTGKDADAMAAELQRQGFKETGRKSISTAAMNEMAGKPEGQRLTLLGPNQPEKPFSRPMFQTDLTASVGARAAAHERTMASARMSDLVSGYRLDLPPGRVEGNPALRHYAKPIRKPAEGSPFANLVETGLYDSYFPRPVAQMIDQMTALADHAPSMERLLAASDRALGLWKSAQLYHPSYIIRNVFQNFFGGLMAGANPLAVGARMKDGRMLAAAIESGNLSGLAGQTIRLANGRVMPAEQAAQIVSRMHLAGGGRTAAEIPARFAGRTVGQQAAATAGRGRQQVHGAVYRLNQNVEDSMKIATLLHFMDTGMDAESAVMRTLMAMPDLTDLTAWERNGLARLLPWYRWIRHNGALQLFHYLPQKPAYAAMLPKFQNLVEGIATGGENVPEALRPAWMREQQGAQISGDRTGGSVFLPANWFPFEQLHQLLGAGIDPEEAVRQLVAQSHPLAKAGLEAASGRSLFRKTELTPLREAGLGAVPKALAGRSNTFLDSMLALRPVREWGPGGRVAEMPTAGRSAQRLLLGGAVQPVDYGRGLQARYYELETQQRDLRAQYNRALQAGDKGLADDLLKRWLAVVRQMYQWKFPVNRGMEQTLAGAGVERTGPP